MDEENEVMMHRAVIKALLKTKNSKRYENDVAYILEGKEGEGVYYENRIYPHDFTFSTGNYTIREITDEEFKELISSSIILKSEVSGRDTWSFYFGMMYSKRDNYELCYNFFRDQREEQGIMKEELPLSMKIKIYSNKKSVFQSNIKKG